MLFLIEFSRKGGVLLTLKMFDESKRNDATTERLEKELYWHSCGINYVECIILEAESMQVARQAWSRYFYQNRTK